MFSHSHQSSKDSSRPAFHSVHSAPKYKLKDLTSPYYSRYSSSLAQLAVQEAAGRSLKVEVVVEAQYNLTQALVVSMEAVD